MNSSKCKTLQKAGWSVGSVSDFLGLSPEEAVLVEVKLALADRVRELRKQRRMTQVALAKGMGSSQSRIAKMEAANHSVSVDFYVKSLAFLGSSPKDIGVAISHFGKKNRGTKSAKRAVTAKPE